MIGVDLGTTNVRIHVKGKGVLLREPAVIAVVKGTTDVKAVGQEAYRMLGRTPGNITAVRPMADGVIADYTLTEKMLKAFIGKVLTGPARFLRHNIMVCVPSGITEVEKRAVVQAAHEIGARKAFLIEEPVAGAIGAGIKIAEPLNRYIRKLYDNSIGLSADGLEALKDAVVAIQQVVDHINEDTGFLYSVGAGQFSSQPLPNTVTVDAPSSAAGDYLATSAAFGPLPTVGGLTGAFAVVNDGSGTAEGCSALIGFPAGAIAIADRGTCGFAVKVKIAQDAGASAVVIANNAPGSPITMGGADPTITIPSVMVSQADGATIKAGLPATGGIAANDPPPLCGTGLHMVDINDPM